MAKELKPVFEKPYGSAERNWGNQAAGTDLLCQMCGNVTEGDSDNSVPFLMFGERQLVVDCCGRFVDQVFEQWGAMFAEAYLGDFANNPTNPDPSLIYFRDHLLPSALTKARDRITATGQQVDRLITQLL